MVLLKTVKFMHFYWFTQSAGRTCNRPLHRQNASRGKSSILFIMRTSTIGLALVLFSLQLSYSREARSQDLLERRVSIDVTQKPLESVLSLLHEETGVDIVYSSRVDLSVQVSFSASRQPLKDVLDELLSHSG